MGWTMRPSIQCRKSRGELVLLRTCAKGGAGLTVCAYVDARRFDDQRFPLVRYACRTLRGVTGTAGPRCTAHC